MAEAAVRTLVLGGTGMLGHEVVGTLAAHGEVHASVRDPERARRYRLPATLHSFRAEAAHELPALLDRAGPEVVVNCIGLVKQLPDASDPPSAIRLNSLLPHQAAAACHECGARLIHVSTDCVFSGDLEAPALYTEDDIPDARDLYGRTKLIGEVTEGDALTLRTSIVGWELERSSGLLAWLAGRAGASVRGFTHASFSGLTTRAFAQILASVIHDTPGLSGLYHVASEPISKHDLLVLLNEAFQLGCSVEPVDEPRINRALDPTRFCQDAQVEIPSWPAMISEYSKGVVHEPLAG